MDFNKEIGIKLVSDDNGYYLADLEGNRVTNVKLKEFKVSDGTYNLNPEVTLVFDFIPIEMNRILCKFYDSLEPISEETWVRNGDPNQENSELSSS